MRIAMISEHASPLAVLGTVDAGGQNVHVAELSRHLGRRGHDVRVYTRRDDPGLPELVPFADAVAVVHVDAGPPRPLPKDELRPLMPAFGEQLAAAWTGTDWRPISVGIWNIANTSPCLREQGGNYWAHSTVQSGDTVGGCDVASPVPPGTAPAGIWSKNSLIVDCAGAYKLCFRIRAGVYENPSPNDCILGEVCTNVDYKEANVEQPLPDLPTWAGKDNACAKKWEFDTPEDKSPGYGEMIVYGKTVRCDEVADNGQEYVFHRVKYCPRICRPSHPTYNPSHPECKDCQLKGSGKFE